MECFGQNDKIWIFIKALGTFLLAFLSSNRKISQNLMDSFQVNERTDTCEMLRSIEYLRKSYQAITCSQKVPKTLFCSHYGSRMAGIEQVLANQSVVKS